MPKRSSSTGAFSCAAMILGGGIAVGGPTAPARPALAAIAQTQSAASHFARGFTLRRMRREANDRLVTQEFTFNPLCRLRRDTRSASRESPGKNGVAHGPHSYVLLQQISVLHLDSLHRTLVRELSYEETNC